MNMHFTGRVILICPDCETHLVNVASCGERYHCTDCELTLIRQNEGFGLHRFGEVIGTCTLEQILMQVHWQPAAWMPAHANSRRTLVAAVTCSE